MTAWSQGGSCARTGRGLLKVLNAEGVAAAPAMQDAQSRFPRSLHHQGGLPGAHPAIARQRGERSLVRHQAGLPVVEDRVALLPYGGRDARTTLGVRVVHGASLLVHHAPQPVLPAGGRYKGVQARP
ncbi:hypothetical protein HC928_10420 [bacterium]|nr:hypothetical protein [bacterium]